MRVVVMLTVVLVLALLSGRTVNVLLRAVIANITEYLIRPSHCFKSSTCVISMVKSKFLQVDVWV